MVVEQSERRTAIVHCLRVLAHTSQVDPEFFSQCIEEARADVTPGFGSPLEQNESEFTKLLSHVGDCRSALEIGSRYGESAKRIAAAMQPKSKIVCVDLPYVDAGSMPSPEPILRYSIKEMNDAGHEATLFLGDSHDQRVIGWVKERGPFDFVFIDGDHSYEGVKQDWENYGPLGKIVGFHDIVNNTGCFRLWQEVKKEAAAKGWRVAEYTESLWLGIGVVFKEGN